MSIRYSKISEAGQRPENQDALFAGVDGDYAIFVVADGMGGHSFGEVASKAIVEAASEWWLTTIRSEQNVSLDVAKQQCLDAMQRVNRELYYQYASKGTMVGSTMVLLLIWENEYAILSLGDSHIYRKRKDELKPMTVDDVWENLPEVNRNMTIEEIRNDQRYGKLICAIGAHENPEIHVYDGKLGKNETFLLCSDGIYKYCPLDVINRIICKGIFQRNTNVLINKLKRISQKNGTKDNYTAILCQM